MSAEDVEQSLIDQLLHQFKHSENILKLIGVLGDMLQDTFDVAAYIQSMVDLDDYTGEFLEFWGELIGVGRPLANEDPANIFTICSLGEAGDVDHKTNFLNDDDSVELGGYIDSYGGLPSITDPGALMTDIDYRFLIRQKAASFRSEMTHTNLYSYLLAFGARCKIDDDTQFQNKIDPQNFNDLDSWQKWYVEKKGFKPGGVGVRFKGNIRDQEDI